jgi:hypothetical protein
MNKKNQYPLKHQLINYDVNQYCGVPIPSLVNEDFWIMKI